MNQWSGLLVSMGRLAQAVGIEAGVGTAHYWRCCPSFSSLQFHYFFQKVPQRAGMRPLVRCPCCALLGEAPESGQGTLP